MKPLLIWGSFGRKRYELKNRGITVSSKGRKTLRGIDMETGGREELDLGEPDDGTISVTVVAASSEVGEEELSAELPAELSARITSFEESETCWTLPGFRLNAV